jgi:hypothetical protein
MRSLSVFSIFICLLILCIPGSEGLDKDDNYSYKSSGMGGSSILVLDVPTALYQDQGILFNIVGSTDPNWTIEYDVANGSIGTLSARGLRRLVEYDEWGEARHGGEEKGLLPSLEDQGPEWVGYILAPDYLDENFEMTMIVTIRNGTDEPIIEEHSFFVVGEPIVIEGSDPFDELKIGYIIGFAIIGGILFWGVPLLVDNLNKRKKGRKGE